MQSRTDLAMESQALSPSPSGVTSRRTTHGNNLKRIDTANIHTKNQTSKQKCKIFYKKWYLQTTQSIDKCKY